VLAAGGVLRQGKLSVDAWQIGLKGEVSFDLSKNDEDVSLGS
jgi:hypothetical protein